MLESVDRKRKINLKGEIHQMTPAIFRPMESGVNEKKINCFHLDFNFRMSWYELTKFLSRFLHKNSSFAVATSAMGLTDVKRAFAVNQ